MHVGPRILSIILLSLAGLSGCATFTVDEAYMFPSFGPGQLESVLPDDYTVTEHELERADGTHVYGISLVGSAEAPDLLYLGGNHQSVDRAIEHVAENFLAVGRVNIHFFDRRGQGRSTGTGGVDHGMKDAMAIFDYVRERVDGPLIVHGLSLGGFEAAAVAAERPVDALVLEATATNVDEFVSTAIPWYAKPFVTVNVADELRTADNREPIADYQGPLLLLAGEDDTQTAPEMMESLYNVSPSDEKRFVVVPDAHHGNAMRKTMAREAYTSFLEDTGLLL